MKIGGRLVIIMIGGRLVLGVGIMGSLGGKSLGPGRLIITDALAARPKVNIPNTTRDLRIADDRFIHFPFVS
jgi:hypothetical protein